MPKMIAIILAIIGLIYFTTEDDTIINKDMPEFNYPDLYDDNKMINKAYIIYNAPVLITFWGTWCGACGYAFPKWKELSDNYGVKMIGVTLRSSKSEIIDYLGKNGNPFFKTVHDKEGTISASRWLVRGVPTTYLIDKNGKVVGQADTLNSSPQKIAEMIKKLQ